MFAMNKTHAKKSEACNVQGQPGLAELRGGAAMSLKGVGLGAASGLRQTAAGAYPAGHHVPC